MKDYISLVPDEELSQWVVDYLNAVGWQGSPVCSLDNVSDIIVERGKNNAIITFYFDHYLKDYDHQEYVENYSYPNGHENIKVHQSFVVDSFGIEGIDLHIDQTQGLLFSGEKIEDDIKKFWCNKMFQKFRDTDETWIQDFQQHQQKMHLAETQQEESEIANQLSMFTDQTEPGL